MLRLLLALLAAPLLAATLAVAAAPVAQAQTRAEIADAEYKECMKDVFAGDIDTTEVGEGIEACVREQNPELFKELDAFEVENAGRVNDIENKFFVIQKAENWKGTKESPRLFLHCGENGSTWPVIIDWNGSLASHDYMVPVQYRFDEGEANIAYLLLSFDERTDFQIFRGEQVEAAKQFDERLLKDTSLQILAEKSSGGFITAEFNLRDMRSKVAQRC